MAKKKKRPAKPGRKPAAKKSSDALTLAEASAQLRGAGARGLTVARLKADVAAGAPTEAGGRIRLAAYAAWLLWGTVHAK